MRQEVLICKNNTNMETGIVGDREITYIFVQKNWEQLV
jgi:hypothetical protein